MNDLSIVITFYVIFHDDDEHEDVSSLISLFVALLSKFGRGAQIRTVASSDADANIDG